MVGALVWLLGVWIERRERKKGEREEGGRGREGIRERERELERERVREREREREVDPVIWARWTFPTKLTVAVMFTLISCSSH